MSFLPPNHGLLVWKWFPQDFTCRNLFSLTLYVIILFLLQFLSVTFTYSLSELVTLVLAYQLIFNQYLC